MRQAAADDHRQFRDARKVLLNEALKQRVAAEVAAGAAMSVRELAVNGRERCRIGRDSRRKCDPRCPQSDTPRSLPSGVVRPERLIAIMEGRTRGGSRQSGPEFWMPEASPQGCAGVDEADPALSSRAICVWAPAQRRGSQGRARQAGRRRTSALRSTPLARVRRVTVRTSRAPSAGTNRRRARRSGGAALGFGRTVARRGIRRSRRAPRCSGPERRKPRVRSARAGWRSCGSRPPRPRWPARRSRW